VFILGGLVMARLIQFYVPQTFTFFKRQWAPLAQRGKIIAFRRVLIKKKSA
jgi:hypothetical protein